MTTTSPYISANQNAPMRGSCFTASQPPVTNGNIDAVTYSREKLLSLTFASTFWNAQTVTVVKIVADNNEL